MSQLTVVAPLDAKKSDSPIPNKTVDIEVKDAKHVEASDNNPSDTTDIVTSAADDDDSVNPHPDMVAIYKTFPVVTAYVSY